MRIDFNALAKLAVSTMIAMKASDIVEDQLDMRTSINTDKILVQGGCMLAGHMISGVTDPFTDRAVDYLGQQIVQLKNKKQNKTPAE